MVSAPTTTPHEQASTVTAFAKDLHELISSTNASSSPLAIPDNILRTLDTHLTQLPLSRTALTTSTRHQFDTKGTELWNTCLQVMGTCGEGGVRGLLSKVKCLAFVMIESATPRRGTGNVRALELALRTAKVCLESEHLELGLKALEIAAARLDTFEKSEADKLRLSAATTEYYMLRIYLSWFQGRPDIAEHLLSKTSDTQGSLEQQKTIIEVCYIIGSSALSKGQPDVAVRWLERALKSSSCSNQDSEPSDLALKDMRLLILHTLVRARLQLNTPNSRDCALQALNSLKTEHRDIFPVVMLQLELFSKEHLNYNDYSECLKTAVRMMELTDVTLKTAFYHIQKLSKHSWDLSMKVSRQLLLEKLIPSGNHTLIGQYFVAFVWMVTDSNKPASQELDTIVDAAKTLDQPGIDALSEDTTHASLVLIWRRIENMISNGDISIAEQWCQFVLEQPIFHNCSTANRGVLQRKLMICALNNPDTSLTYEALERILERSYDTPSTLYLAYMITLLHDEPDLGTSVLEALYKLGANGATFLLSCAAEAQRLGNLQQMMGSIQRVIMILNSGYREGLDFPTLVGSTIHILSTELDNCGADDTKILEQIHRTFQAALKGLTESSSTFSRNDIQWLFQKSYNLALQLVRLFRYSAAIELLDVFLELADLYPQTAEPKDTSEVLGNNLSCNFLKALILIIEAREESNPLEKKNHYTNLRNTIEHFRAHIANHPQLQQNHETTVPEKWQENYRALLSFDFEAAVFLSQGDCLPRIIEESSSFADSRLCAVFLDSILFAEAPVSEMVRVVMTIINTLHTSPSPTLNKSSFEISLPCYLRCLFQLSLQANEIPLAEAILDKAISLARGYDDNTNTDNNMNENGITKSYDYPNEELEWLATMTFNRAIDFYLVSADEECRRWAGKAIEVADLVGYNQGALGRLLRANLAKLS